LQKYPNASIEVEELDLSKSESIKKFIETISKKYHKVDVLVNNAAIAAEGFTAEAAESTFATNIYGTIELTEAIIPLLNENGKIITVGSSYGNIQLAWNAPEWKPKFTNPSITKEQLFGYMNEFQDSIKKGDYVERGFPNSQFKIYGMSKLAINVYTMNILAKRQDIKDKHIQVYAQCPGYVKTDLNDNKGYLSIDQGA